MKLYNKSKNSDVPPPNLQENSSHCQLPAFEWLGRQQQNGFSINFFYVCKMSTQWQTALESLRNMRKNNRI